MKGFYTVITTVALVATSLSVGYAIGVNSASAKRPGADGKSGASKPRENEEGDEDEEEDEEEVADGDLSAVNPRFLEPCKMVNICTCNVVHIVPTDIDPM